MRVCVIGAGASGLTSIKACKEEQVDVVCYERSDHMGGLWRYDEKPNGLTTTVSQTTIANASKETTSFSDFPAPSNYPNYFHHSLMLKYLENYAEAFDLAKHIVYQTKVVSVKAADHLGSGRWKVIVRDLDSNQLRSEEYDSVMICTGHFNRPIKPNFKGQDSFKGEIIHTQAYKNAERFGRKRVCVVGFGNSAVDAAVDLSYVAEKVYLSTRRGGWVLNRLAPGTGQPVDTYLLKRLINVAFSYLPAAVANGFLETLVQKHFDHRMYGLQPDYRINQGTLVVNDALASRVISGSIILKNDVERFEADGLVFKGEDEVCPVDRVILGTGYEMEFPFLDQKIVNIEDNRPNNLYKLQYAVEQPHTLAFIGLINPSGPLLPISELQSRWHLQLLTGKCKSLPSAKSMWKDIKSRENALRMRYYDSKRHTIGVQFVPFMDREIASQFGARPNLLRLLFTDPLLWYYCLFKTALPAQYRLQGPHSNYRTARATILSYERRILDAFQSRQLYDYRPADWFGRTIAGLCTILVTILLLFF